MARPSPRRNGSQLDLTDNRPSRVPVRSNTNFYTSTDGNEIFIADNYNHRVQKFTYNPTGIGDPARPPQLTLQSRPNPLTEVTTIRYALPEAGAFHLAVYDVQGRQVNVLASGTGAWGDRMAEWHGDDDGGAPVASGVYFVRLTAGRSEALKLNLIR